MLALRNILCSDRWKTGWPKIAAQLRLRNILKQFQQHQAKLEAKAALAASLLAPALPVVEHSSACNGVELKQPEIPKKVVENSRRKFKFGKAFYQRSSLRGNWTTPIFRKPFDVLRRW
jgi:hypothetical protein